MNYIEQFIKDNGLTIDTYFEIYGRRGKYIFDANFVLWYKPIESNPPIEDSLALVELLTGKCRPATKMEQVAEILGVKLGEEFNITKDGTEIPNGPFKLTGLGLRGEYEVIFPTHFMKLLTGEYKIVPIEQEEL